MTNLVRSSKPESSPDGCSLASGNSPLRLERRLAAARRSKVRAERMYLPLILRFLFQAILPQAEDDAGLTLGDLWIGLHPALHAPLAVFPACLMDPLHASLLAVRAGYGLTSR